MQAVWPVLAWKVPAAHAVQLPEPGPSAKCPCGAGRQALASADPVPGLNVPGGPGQTDRGREVGRSEWQND